MFLDKMTLKEVRKKSEALREIGISKVCVDVSEFPFEATISCEPGGSHRLEIATSVWFRAEDVSGIELQTTFDIEPSSANGSGGYHIDSEAVTKIIARMNGYARGQFQRYLCDCADKVEARGKEYLEIAAKQMGDAAILRSLGKMESKKD